MEIAYQYYPHIFTRLLTPQEIMARENELELMKLITSTLKLPTSFEKVTIYSVYAPGKPPSEAGEHQADTKDTILELMKTFSLPKNLPLLFTSTLPYIIRQGLQAKYYLPDYQLDICAADYPYLETLNTPLKGRLPASLYLDELHWLLETLSSFTPPSELK